MSLFSRLRRSGKPVTPRRRPTKRRLSSEPLEERTLLAVDLVGLNFNVRENSAVPGDTINIDWEIANPGNGASGGFYVHFYMENDSTGATSFRGSEFVSGMSAFGRYASSTTVWLPQWNDSFWSNAGSYKVSMFIDPYGNVSETNESNNSHTGFSWDYDTVSVQLRPDIFAKNFSIVGGSNAQPGDSFSLSFDVQNLGAAAAGGFGAAVFLSTDATITTSDRLFALHYFGGLGAGATSGITFGGLQLPDASDSFWASVGSQSSIYIGVMLDNGNEVIESNENNNSNEGLGWDTAQITLAPRPDLRGTQFSIDDPTTLQSGGQGSFSYRAVNVGNAVAPQSFAGLYLSRDANITTADRYLRSVTISSLGSLDTQSGSNMSFLLPDSADAFWDGATGDTYYLGLIYDYDGTVSETNETNNANLGLGIDVAQVTIDVSIDLEKLPPNSFKAGELAREFLYRTRLYLQQVSADLGVLRKDIGAAGAAVVSELRTIVDTLRRDVQALETVVQRIGSGRMAAADLGGGLVLDANQIALFERFIVYLVTDVLGTSSVTVQGGDAVMSAAADETPEQTLESLKKEIAKDTDPKVVYDDAAKALKAAAKVAAAVNSGAAVALAKAAAVAKTVGRIAKEGHTAILRGKPIDAENLKANIAAAKQKLLNQIQGISNNITARGNQTAKKIGKLFDDLKEALPEIDPFFQRLGENFQAIFNVARGRNFNGRWNGSNFDPGGSNKMSVSFNRNSGATPTGSVQFISRSFQGGALIKTERMTGTFSGRWTTDNKIQGNITIRNSRGQTVTLPFSWNYDGNSLSGSLFDGSGNFSVTK